MSCNVSNAMSHAYALSRNGHVSRIPTLRFDKCGPASDETAAFNLAWPVCALARLAPLLPALWRPYPVSPRLDDARTLCGLSVALRT
jgi:hypothetical protein